MNNQDLSLNISSKQRRTNLIIYVLFYLGLFLFNPTLSLLVSFVVVASNPATTQRQYFTFYVLLAAWLGVLNMTKELFSDQIYYTRIFVSVDTSNIFEAIYNYRENGALSFKEIVFNVYSVLVNLFTAANPRAYFFIITVNVYLLHFISIHKVLFASRRSKLDVVCSILLMAFTFQFFIQSVHAVRQILATSFVVYAIAYRAVYGKNHWPFLLIAFFIHNSTILYAILALLPQLYRKLSYKQLFIYLFTFIVFTQIYSRIGEFLETANLGVLSNVGERMATAKESTEAELFSLRNTLIYTLPLVLCSFCVLIRDYKRNILSPLGTIAYVTLLNIILVLGVSSAPTLQFRYTMYIYSFLPFLLLMLGKSRMPIYNLYILFVTSFFVFRFFFVDVDWSKFAPWTDIIFHSFIHFWVTPYFMV